MLDKLILYIHVRVTIAKNPYISNNQTIKTRPRIQQPFLRIFLVLSLKIQFSLKHNFKFITVPVNVITLFA